MDKNKDRQGLAKFFYALSFAGQLGFIIIIPLLIFGYFGLWLDKKIKGHNLVFIFFIFLGFLSAGWSVYKWLKPLLKDD